MRCYSLTCFAGEFNYPRLQPVGFGDRLIKEIMMSKFFEQIPWVLLIPAALLLGLAPFWPEPHLLEKLRLLIGGQLVRPVDIFDLILHGTPWLFVLGKLLFGRQAASK